jgi:polyisoprenoid-binding protein YceI
MTGDLTIKGVTHPVTLNVVKYGEFNDPRMGHRIGYAAETKINRKDFGMAFDMMLDGKLIVSHQVQVNIEGELLEVEAKEPAKTTA